MRRALGVFGLLAAAVTLATLSGSRALAVDDPVPQVPIVRAGTAAPHWCGTSQRRLPNVKRTTHFVIWYDEIRGGLSIRRYATVLERVWRVVIDDYGWARPPRAVLNPTPGGRYPVRIDRIPGYGYVHTIGFHTDVVGDNPYTAWAESDAIASCMVLNNGFANLPGANMDDLKVTAAHEFFHTISFGLGIKDDIDGNLQEGGAAWMEDEVFDSVNDNYQYLWPKWEESMGAYPVSQNEPGYSYWLVWRGLTERYGSGKPGGAEDLMQRALESVSKGQEMMPAIEGAFWDLKHTYLGWVFHQYAVAARFMKPCVGGYAPLCFEEAGGYEGTAGDRFVYGSLFTDYLFPGSIRDDYSLHWIELPDAPELYPLGFKNISASSTLFWSVACDLGNEIRFDPWGRVEPGERGTLWVDRSGCDGASYATVTNEHVSAGNPTSSPEASYEMWVALLKMKGTLTWIVEGSASGSQDNISWSENWNENGNVTVSLKRGDPADIPEWMVVDDNSSYTLDYTEDRTETNSLTGCVTTYDGQGSGSGALVSTSGFPGTIGSTFPNVDPPDANDPFGLPDPLDLWFSTPLDYTETWDGDCRSGTWSESSSGPYYHGIVSAPACVPDGLVGADPNWWQPIAPFSAAWNESAQAFEFECSVEQPVDGGSQTITIGGTVSYDIQT